MMRHSRTTQLPGQPVYIASTAVVLAEVVKLVSCLLILYTQSNSRPRELALMAVPSALYAAASFQVTYQMKILSTAIFSVILLGNNPLIGLSAVMTACLLSGFAGCYFERDGGAIIEYGMLRGYNILTWSVLINQALGGLLVALVVKYADNILKGFATSISIVLSGIISYFVFGFEPNHLFILGTAVVIAATVLYAKANVYTVLIQYTIEFT
ncbi:nucleotide-sugar transporter-domain-containing protein [Syncephalis plumigaleata]|nr:nucleotide-sugar transporter-domain-containing protein [Syncephalis plumigaleata]